MFKKTYRLKTHCKCDIHSSKTANIILPGLLIKKNIGERPQAMCISEIVFKFGDELFSTNFHALEFEIRFACTRKQESQRLHAEHDKN